MQVVKNKVTPPKNRLAKYTIAFDHGIFGLNDTINMAIALNIIAKTGAWFTYINEDGEIMCDADGNSLKWQGKPNLITYAVEHEDFAKELEQKVLGKIC